MPPVWRYENMTMTIPMNLGEDSYEIVVERGLLAKAKEYLNLDRLLNE